MKAKQYAQALSNLLRAGSSFGDVMKGLDRVLLEKGHSKLKRLILRHLLGMLSRKVQGATVYIAARSDMAKNERAIEKLLKTYHVDEKPTVVVHESLIGGFRFDTETVSVDRSYKRALQELYHNIVSK